MTIDTRKRYTFRMPNGLFEKLRNEARENGMSLNATILWILEDWLEKRRS